MEQIEMQLRTFFRSPISEPQQTPAIDDEYAHWRREADAVGASYRVWNRAPRRERWLAYANYLAMIDREERAACAYRRAVQQVSDR